MGSKQKWETLKSGVRKNGSWFCGEYPTGWYLWNSNNEVSGPYKNIDDAMKAQEKK